MPLYYYGDQLSPNIIETPNGVLICKDVPIGRTGTLNYLEKDIIRDSPNPFNRVTAYRQEEDVFDVAAIASFEGMAVTDGHPAEDVTTDNWNIYAKGHVQNVRRGEGENLDKMVADLFITDPVLKDKIKNKLFREVSSGYNCRYLPQADGTFRQVMLRGNHVAIVKDGRAGSSVAIKDSKPDESKQTDERRPLFMSMSGNPVTNALKMLVMGSKSVQDASEQDALVKSTAQVLETIAAKDAAENVPVAMAPAQDANVDPIATLTAAIQDMVRSNDELTKELKEGKKEQKAAGKELADGDKKGDKAEERRAGKELADGDKKVKEAKDAAVIDVSPMVEAHAGAEKADRLDVLLQKLTGDEASAGVDDEMEVSIGSKDAVATDALIVPMDNQLPMADPNMAKDAAIMILKHARPAIAAMKDPQERARVTDALIQSIEGQLGITDAPMADIMQITKNAAKMSAMDSASSGEFDIDVRQAAYDKRNPHNED